MLVNFYGSFFLLAEQPGIPIGKSVSRNRVVIRCLAMMMDDD